MPAPLFTARVQVEASARAEIPISILSLDLGASGGSVGEDDGDPVLSGGCEEVRLLRTRVFCARQAGQAGQINSDTQLTLRDISNMIHRLTSIAREPCSSHPRRA